LKADEPAIRVAVADDHPAIGSAVAAAIAADQESPPLAYLGQARRVAAALALTASGAPERPEVLLCDLQIEAAGDGLAVIEAAGRAGIRAIAYTSFDRASLMRAVFERGGAGFLPKATELEAVLAAIRTVARGGTAFSAIALEAARDAVRPPSAREIEVIRLLMQGATSDEAGHRLGISARTVESHLRRLFDRYGVVSRTELVVLAQREAWVDDRDA
jgi:DNA-binding NarL/FixJ family response regulator